jgi:hypothetical protein
MSIEPGVVYTRPRKLDLYEQANWEDRAAIYTALDDFENVLNSTLPIGVLQQKARDLQAQVDLYATETRRAA